MSYPNTVERICPVCSRVFFAKKKDANRGKCVYCSRSCAGKVRKTKDIVGQVFGRLTVIARSETLPQYDCACWLVRCDCGTEQVTSQQMLLKGSKKSCGCLSRELKTKHGGSKDPEFNVWKGMIRRCYVEKDQGYKNYGARGISVCDRWRRSYPLFLEDMGRRPEGVMSIDRIDTNGNYEPENCRWATNRQQSRNRRDNREITYNGKTQILSDWATELEIHVATLHRRLEKGWSVEDALGKPIQKKFSRTGPRKNR
jgi:hypothetical protein